MPILYNYFCYIATMFRISIMCIRIEILEQQRTPNFICNNLFHSTLYSYAVIMHPYLYCDM